MSKVIKDILFLSIITLTVTFIIWLPHILAVPSLYGLNFSQGFATIYRNFDGLNYIVIAKSFYDPYIISQFPYDLPTNYYPAHFPGYPALIALFAPILGYLKSMLFVSLLFTIFSAVTFYFLVRNFKLSSSPLWLSIVFLLLPARWVIVHSIGSPEPVFIFFLLLAAYFFLKFETTQKTLFLWHTAAFSSLAVLTRPPGILIFISLMLYLFYKNLKKESGIRSIFVPLDYPQLLLIPLTLVGIFTLFYIQTGDFLAYFHSGDNIHLTFPPYQVFNKFQYWVGDIWLEDIVYIFLLGFIGGIRLLKTNFAVAGFFVLTYLIATILVAHRDISRYSLPVFPFVLIAFEKFINTKEFKIAFAIIAAAIYLYTQNFILQNTTSVFDLTNFN